MKVLIKALKTENVNIGEIFIWCFISFCLPLFAKQLTALNIIQIIIYWFNCYYIGKLLVTKIERFDSLESFINTGVSLFLGSLFNGFLFLLLPYSAIQYIIFGVYTFGIIINKQIAFDFNFIKCIGSLLPIFCLFFIGDELVQATTKFCATGGDYFFYSTIVQSLKINQNFNSTIYAQNIATNYMFFPFIAPAQLANFAGLSSQLALWGVYLKLAEFLSFALIANTIIIIAQKLYANNFKGTRIYLKLLITSCLLLLFAPLHFVNIIKFNFSKVLLHGTGYLLPTGSPGYCISIILLGILLLLILTTNTPKVAEKILVIFCLAFFAGSKIALLFPTIIFIGLYSIFLSFKKNNSWFICIFMGGIAVLLVYYWIMYNPDSSSVMKFTRFGIQLTQFEEFAVKLSIKGSLIKKVFIAGCICIFNWCGIKLLLLLVSLKEIKTKFNDFSIIVFSLLITLIISFLPSFFLQVDLVDEFNNYITDGSFDLIQFIRSAFFIITIFAILSLLYYLFYVTSKIWRIISFSFVSIWILLISYSFAKSNFGYRLIYDTKWYYEAKIDCDKVGPKLLAAQCNSEFSGQLLTTLGVYPFYCTGTRADGDGYIFTKTEYKRNTEMRILLDSTQTLSQRKIMINKLKQNNVDCLIATPTNIKKFNKAVNDSLLMPIANTKWMYKFK